MTFSILFSDAPNVAFGSPDKVTHKASTALIDSLTEFL